MGTHLRVLSESFPMNTNMTGFRWFSKNLCTCVLWTKEASTWEGLMFIFISFISVHQDISMIQERGTSCQLSCDQSGLLSPLRFTLTGETAGICSFCELAAACRHGHLKTYLVIHICCYHSFQFLQKCSSRVTPFSDKLFIKYIYMILYLFMYLFIHLSIHLIYSFIPRINCN